MADIQTITQLRETSGAGMMDCKKALDESNGDIEKALEILRKKGDSKATKKLEERQTKEGVVYSYIHSNNKSGSMLELLCETDFVARTEGFQLLARELALQIVAMSPEYLSPDQVPSEVIEKEKEIYREQMRNEGKPAEMIEKIIEGKLNKFYEDTCLLKQLYVKDDKLKIEDLIKQFIAKTGEKIEVGRFSCFKI
jgi:elongation factor Ts